MKKAIIFVAGVITGRYVITLVDRFFSVLLFGYHDPKYVPFTERYHQKYSSYSHFYSVHPHTSYWSPNKNIKPENYVFKTRTEAEDTRNNLNHLIDEYGYATIGDFYDIVGYIPEESFVETETYGWKNLSSAYVRVHNNGYVIDFPKAEYVK